MHILCIDQTKCPHLPNPTPPASWEEGFDELFPQATKVLRGDPFSGVSIIPELKSFIAAEIARAEKEAVSAYRERLRGNIEARSIAGTSERAKGGEQFKRIILPLLSLLSDEPKA